MRFPGNRILRSLPAYVAIAIVGSWAHLAFASPLYELHHRCLAAYLLLVVLVVAYGFFRNPARIGLVRLMATLQVYVMYGLAQFTQERLILVSGNYVPSSSALTRAMVLVAVGELAMLAGYEIGGRIARQSSLSPFRYYPAPREAWRRIVLCFGVLGIVVHFWVNLKLDFLPIEIANIVLMVINPYLALIVVTFFAYHYRSRSCHVLRFVMTGLMMLFGLLQGMIEIAVQPLFVLVASAIFWGPGVRLRWCAVVVVAFMIINPIKHNYRALTWHGNERANLSSWDGVHERINNWIVAAEKTWGDPFAAEHNLSATADRTSGLLALAQVIDWVPDAVPYNEGEGFAAVMLFFVPRILWPDKPHNNDIINNRYGVMFRFTTTRGVATTTFGTLLPADGYWDFGALGAIGYLGACGLLFGWMFGGCKRRREPIEEIAELLFACIFLQALVGLFNILSSLFALLVGTWIGLKAIDLLSGARRSANKVAIAPSCYTGPASTRLPPGSVARMHPRPHHRGC